MLIDKQRGIYYGKEIFKMQRGGGNSRCATHVAHWNNSRKIAFTLAEVLITLGIIGVVSAMTVPTLMQNYQRQSYVTQLHKVYNELTQAAVQYQNDKNAVDLKEAGLTSQAAAEEFIESNFKIVQNCGANKTPCFANTYRKIANSQNIGWNSIRTNYVLASGATLGVGYNPLSSDCLLELYVDTNGAKGPNIAGRDLWALFLYKDGSVDDFSGDPPPLTTAQRETAFTTSCTSDNANSWNGCFGKILNDNWQMTY